MSNRREVLRAYLPNEEPRGEQPTITVEVRQHDWIPGFAAYLGGSVLEGPAHVVLNVGAFMASVEAGDMEAKDVPYLVAESLMHEVMHALEDWAGVEFSEDRVEALLAKYRSSTPESETP